VKRKFGCSLLWSALVFGVVNVFHFSRQVTCWDCFFPYGLPFTFFTAGGFAGGRGIVWGGLLSNAMVVFVVGAIFAWVWNWFSGKISN
jgi:hypothetical protein